MRWMLVTTTGKNPGDDFICEGVKSVVRSVDKDPIFQIIDKEVPEQWQNHKPFDKAVWCGMPVFWSEPGNECSEISWSRFLLGSFSERKSDCLVVGAGSFTTYPRIHINSPGKVIGYASAIKRRCYDVWVRDSVANAITSQDFHVATCPAILAGYDKSGTYPDQMLCNIMPEGSHYRRFGMKESKVWDSMKGDIAKILCDAGFTFVAHRADEARFAKEHGWNDGNIISYNGSNALDLALAHRHCRKYFGNRIHGAIAARSFGGDSICVNYDSRINAANIAGCESYAPSQLSAGYVKDWVGVKRTFPHSTQSLFDEYRALFKRFLER